MPSIYRRAGWSLIAVAALLFSFAVGAAGVGAQTGPSASDTSLLTIPAGQSAQLQVKAFCLDFGKTFPAGMVSPNALAKPELRAALNYAIQKGYVDSDPRQVEQAVWYLNDGIWHSTDRTIAEEIVNNSKTGQAPTDPTTGTTIFDAMSQGGLTATVTFTPLTSDAFNGDGTLTIKNTGTADVQVYLPLGTVFPAPSADQQRMVGYTIRVAQAAPTATAAPTAMPAPTMTATLPQVPTTGGQQLPTTGGPADGTLGWLLFAAALLSMVGGLALLRRANERI